MLPPGLLSFPLLAILIAATALFGADSPLPSIVFSGTILAFGVPSLRREAIDSLRPAIWTGMWSLVVITLGQVSGPSVREALPDLVVLLAGAALFLSFASLASSPAGRETVTLFLNLSLLVVAIASFVDYVASPELLYGSEKTFHEYRLTAAFLSANTAATLFGMASVFALGQVLRLAASATDAGTLIDRFARGGMVPSTLLIFSLTCLVLTASRGGIALTFLASGAYAIWLSRRSSSVIGWKAIAGAVLGVGAIILVVSGSGVTSRLFELGTDDTGRRVMWTVSIEAWKAAPFFGHGFGQFDTAIAPFITKDTAAILSTQGAAHNFVLQWLVQAGIIGTLGGAVLAAAAMYPLVRGLRVRRRGQRLMASLMAVAGLVWCHGLIDYAVEIPVMVWWFAAFLGLGAGTAIADRPQPRKRRRRRGEAA